MANTGLLRAGEILLLVGSILHAISAAILVLSGILLFGFGASSSSGEQPVIDVLAFLGPIRIAYTVLGIVSLGGAIVGFMAYGRARSGDAGAAFAFGLTSALLPPLAIVQLIGAILCKVSPEGTAQATGAPPTRPPQ